MSLEKVLDFSEPFTLEPHQSQTARALLRTLTGHSHREHASKRGYKPAELIQATFDHVACKDAFLMFFLSFMYSALCSAGPTDAIDANIALYLAYFDDLASWDSARLSEISGAIEGFAEYIIENFLLPLRASSVKTPQPTPTSLSSIQTSTPTGTTQRLSILREKCLVRDRHRCVISRKFDRREAAKRFERDGEDCKDDDGKLLRSESSDRFQFLEVAHILPHSLMAVTTGDTELSDSKKIALKILDMFDPGIVHLIEYPRIDSPLNALTLTLDYHRLFGEFQIYFEPTGEPYQYRIDSTERSPFLRDPLFPVTRTLTLSPNRTIDPPSPRLLGVHRAIARIMHLSGAGEYIEGILRDLEEVDVKADGSTNLGYLMNLSLGGWLNTMTVY